MLQTAPMYAYIPVKDLARARQFYEEAIGLRPSEETAGSVVYEFAQHTACFMYPTPNAGTSSASQAFWQVDDVEREVAELKRRGGRGCGRDVGCSRAAAREPLADEGARRETGNERPVQIEGLALA